MILNGGNEKFSVASKTIGITRNYEIDFEGIASFIENQYKQSEGLSIKRWAKEFMDEISCPDCQGNRLKKESLHFKINGKNIGNLVKLDLNELAQWFDSLEGKLSEKQRIIASEILKEIKTRIQFLLDVGLDYLTLDRTSKSLSGGEAQRVKLAKELSRRSSGSTLYILDEPTTGLHFEDIKKLLEILHELVDKGNTVVVIEHNLDVIKTADYVIDIGPEGGDKGGKVVCQGTPEHIKTVKESFTGAFLSAIV